MEYLLIGFGGVLGAISRYGLSKWAGKRWQGSFPLATFCINISGSFVLGLLYVILTRAGAGSAYLKSFAATGFLGAYTTYSTFSFEIVNLMEDGERVAGVVYFLTSIVFGLFAAYAGIRLGEYL